MILVIDLLGRKHDWQSSLAEHAAHRGWPALPEVRHLIDVFGPDRRPLFSQRDWMAFMPTSIDSLCDHPIEFSACAKTIRTLLPSDDSDDPYSLNNAANEALLNLCGWCRGSDFPPIGVCAFPTRLPVLGVVVASDHPLELAIGHTARNEEAAAIFWAGRFRYGTDQAIYASIVCRDRQMERYSSCDRYPEISGSILSHVELLWADLSALSDRACATRLQQEYWV